MSSVETIRRYLAERYAGARFLGLALLLGMAGTATSGAWRELVPVALARTMVTAYLAVLAFRVWDDLADRAVDAERHPERISVTGDASALGAFAVVVAAAVTALVAGGAQPAPRLMALAALGLALALWYTVRSVGARSAVADAHVLMLKYPIIAVVAAPDAYDARALWRAAPALIVLYLLLCTFEWLDDPRLRRRLSSTVRGPLP